MRHAGERVGIGVVTRYVVGAETSAIGEVVVVVRSAKAERHQAVPILRAGNAGEGDGRLVVNGERGGLLGFHGEEKILPPDGGSVAALRAWESGCEQFLQARRVARAGRVYQLMKRLRLGKQITAEEEKEADS